MELSLKDFFAHTRAGSRVVIVGDMLEVGENESQEHHKILTFISEHISKDDTCVVVGKRFYEHREYFPYSFFLTTDEAKAYIQTLALKDKMVFLKASRGIRLEEIL
jgi:UDP-N-acetylmuramoyl-tripeptide--D-alanyl-D-alanine ligase